MNTLITLAVLALLAWLSGFFFRRSITDEFHTALQKGKSHG